VTDLGSTKKEICAAMSALPDSFSAIGGHPMCGKEMAGYGAADADLFRGQTFVLSRTARTNQKIEALTLSMIRQIKAKAMFIPPAEHDQLVAAASHLPYLLSANLMHHAARTEDERIWPVSASGFRDTTRLAGSDPRMMLDILLTNREAVLAQLARYKTSLEALTQLLIDNDEAALASWLEEAQQAYIAYRRRKKNAG
jgi:prephenate dehydrogenase